VAQLTDNFQNDIDIYNVHRGLEQFGNLKILGMVTKLKLEDNMRQPEFKILASFVPFTCDRYKTRGRMINATVNGYNIFKQPSKCIYILRHN
jgi:hypothetical protein